MNDEIFRYWTDIRDYILLKSKSYTVAGIINEIKDRLPAGTNIDADYARGKIGDYIEEKKIKFPEKLLDDDLFRI